MILMKIKSRTLSRRVRATLSRKRERDSMSA